MTNALMIRYLKLDKARGVYKYRRRVPDGLKAVLGKAEFAKKLGTTEEEAMQRYPAYHKQVEGALAMAKRNPESRDTHQIKSDIEAYLLEMDADPYSTGYDESERFGRQQEAESILRKYPVDEGTGYPDPDTLSPSDKAKVDALFGGLDAVEATMTIKGAYAFYLAEKKIPDPHKRKKQLERFARSEQALLSITKVDVPLKNVKRIHARNLRDHYLETLSVSSTKRNITDAKSVFSFADREHDLGLSNPFAKLDYPKTEHAAIEDTPSAQTRPAPLSEDDTPTVSETLNNAKMATLVD